MPITIQHGSLKYKDGNTFESVDCIKGDKGDTGEDGISPSASVSKSGTTTTISVTDKTGTTTAQVLDGTDGISPTASISKSGNTATITITDATGTTAAQLTDGQTPVRGTDYWTASDQASILSDTETYADDLIAVQDVQPTTSQTKIWLPATAPSSVQVPTYAEHTSLATTLAKVTPSNVGARGQMLINDGQGGALWENIASLSINLSSSFDTWEKIWAALDMIPLDGSVLIGISSTAMAVISSNVRTSAAQGTITRTDTDTFDLLLRFSSNVAVCATLTSATSSGCTYSDKKMALESDLGDPSSASAVTGNDAFSKIATLNSKITNLDTYTGADGTVVYKIGKTAQLAVLPTVSTTADNAVISTISDSHFRPASRVWQATKVFNGSSYTDCFIELAINGNISIKRNDGTTVAGYQANYTQCLGLQYFCNG